MNENLDLTKILEGCPNGTKLYSTVLGDVIFMWVNFEDKLYPIVLKAHNECTRESCIAYSTTDGRYRYDYNGECTLFPSKDQRDWSKFERFWDKPKVERFDPKTFQPFDKVLGRDTNDNCWIALFFGHIGKGSHRAVCGYFSWTQCIPYNEETKHLVGTSDDCPEYYKWWKDE